MECPHCKHELRLAEAVPSALDGAFAYVECPRCRRALVARLDGVTTTLMTVREGHRHAATMVRATPPIDRAIGVACGVGGVLVTMVLVIAMIFGGAGVVQILTIASMILGCAGLVVGGLVLDEMLGREKWRASLPHVTLVFGTTPDAYRR